MWLFCCFFPENLEKASHCDAYEIIQTNIDKFVHIAQPYFRALQLICMLTF